MKIIKPQKMEVEKLIQTDNLTKEMEETDMISNKKIVRFSKENMELYQIKFEKLI